MAVLAVAVAGLAAVRDLDDDGLAAPDTLVREGSVEVSGDRTFEIGDEPAGYRIVYRVQERGLEPSSEVVTVSRPFDSETASHAGDSGDGPVRSLQRTALGRLAIGLHDETHDGEEPGGGSGVTAQRGDGNETGSVPAGGRTVLAVGPATAGPDLRLGPVLEAALEHGRLEEREQREVAGRRCQVYRAASSVLGGVLNPPQDPAEEYADVCFDEAGLLLEEWWVVEGRAIRQRLAVEIDEHAPDAVSAGLANEPPTIPVDRGGGSMRRMAPDSAPPGHFFVTDAVPSGFEHIGRFSVIPPQAEAFSDPAQRSYIISSTADVWQRGIDVLVVDQGSTLGNVKPFDLDPAGIEVDLGPLGTGEALLGLGANEVRALLGGGDFVRVYGTLPTAELVTVASSLVETQGNEIVLMEDVHEDAESTGPNGESEPSVDGG